MTNTSQQKNASPNEGNSDFAPENRTFNNQHDINMNTTTQPIGGGTESTHGLNYNSSSTPYPVSHDQRLKYTTDYPSTTSYPHSEPEMIKDEAYTYFPASVPGSDHLLRWETNEGAKRTKSINELDLDFNGELLPGKTLILNALYISTPSMSLSPGELIADIYIDKQQIGRVICDKARPDDDRETDMCLIVDLVQAGIAAPLRTMSNKHFQVKFKTSSGASTSVTAYLDNRYRPTLQLNGRLIDEIDNSVKYYYHPDHNKNIIALSDESGELTAT